jgi:putative chitinase
MLANPAEFFRLVRVGLFRGDMSQPQVDGINAVMAAWPKGTDLRWFAYALATAFHETDTSMEPIAEYGRGRGMRYGVPDPETGQVYYGRGFVQLTWRFNYTRAEKEIPGSDLVAHPDNAMKPEIAATVMVRGMSEGWFTGVSLNHYFPLARSQAADWVNARRIVNGLDCAARIAGYALHFREALEAGEYAA